MNLPRSSILRLMGSIVLMGSALALLRGWAGRNWWFGELAPLTAIGLCGLAMTFVTSGRYRRYFAGLATTGVVVGLAIWLAPIPVRESVLGHCIVPLGFYLFDPDSDWLLDLPDHYFNIRSIRHPFCTHELQAAVGLLELAIATLGGLLAAMPRPRKSRPFISTDP